MSPGICHVSNFQRIHYFPTVHLQRPSNHHFGRKIQHFSGEGTDKKAVHIPCPGGRAPPHPISRQTKTSESAPASPKSLPDLHLCCHLRRGLVTSHHHLYNSSAVAVMDDRLVTIDTGRKVGGGCCALFRGAELGPHLTYVAWAGTYLHTKRDIDPSNRLATIHQGYR